MYRYGWSTLILVLLGCGSLAQTQPVLFTANQKGVTAEEFIHLYRKNHPKTQDYTEAKVNEYLNLLVNFKLKVAEARAQGIDTTTKFVREFKQYREELKRPYRNEPDLLDQLSRETYERLQYELRAAHLLISVKPDAPPADTLAAFEKIATLRKRVLAGEDFGKLARENSQDPSAQQNDGNLGFFTALQMVYPFEQRAYLTEPGQVSEIVRTRFGYHIIKVFEKQRSPGEVEVSHILLRKGGSPDAAVRNRALEAYDQLRGGRAWEDVCKEFSEDTNTRDSGGKLRPFGVGALASVPEFESRAFSLGNPGQLSDVFESGIGWHIIRLERKIPVPPYSELEASLKKRISRDERFSTAQRAIRQRQRAQYGFAENADNKARFLALADSNVVKGKWAYTGPVDFRSQILFSLTTGSFTVDQAIRYVMHNQAPSGLSPAACMENHYSNFVSESIEEAEEKDLLAKNPDFGFLLTEYREGMMLFEIMEREVWKKASDDSTGQAAYYAAHTDKYQASDRVEARLLVASEQTVVDQIRQKVMQGDTLRQADLKKLRQVIGPRIFEKGENKAVDRITWVVGMQQTQIDNNHYLVEIIRLIPPGTQTFPEARARVISDYQTELETQWVARLRNKYPVKVNKKVKKSVLKTLVRSSPAGK
ncbi:MAG: peptidylprolyl isomerase [Cyclobacteriaceae bacterium]|jgi:peptidyl-prolyl cis-trans isomerase SurA|nr:peptidylprolyl isomerase [Flammeovirgaceae bacterium]